MPRTQILSDYAADQRVIFKQMSCEIFQNNLSRRAYAKPYEK